MVEKLNVLDKNKMVNEKRDMEEVYIDYFGCKNFTNGKPMNQKEILDIIRSKEFKEHTDVCRIDLNGEDKKDERRTYKTNNFPLVTFGGTFTTPRSKKTLLNHSGQASIDFDEYNKEKCDLLFEKLKEDPYIHILFRSPSYGLKAIIKIPNVKSDVEYKEYFYGLLNYYKKFSPSQDTGCADVSRLCFLSYDPELFVNESSKIFEIKGKKESKSFDDHNKEDEQIPMYCPFIEKIAAVHTLPSGEKTRHAYLDGNVYKYCKVNDKRDVFLGYKNAQGRPNGAFNNSDSFNFSCGTLRSYMQGNKENGFVSEGLKICDSCPEFEKYQENSTEILLPCQGRLVSDFANKLGIIFEHKDVFYFKPQEHSISEIRKIKEENQDEEFLGFHKIEANRFITAVEHFVTPGMMFKNKDTDELEFMAKSMSNSVASVVLESNIFQSRLPIMKRIFTVPLPIIYDGNLTFPKEGYDKRFYSWLPLDAPKIINEDMSLEEAKKIITFIFQEFPFQERQDYMNAIAGLITPFLRGLYSKFNVRTPIFFYIANRERAGKDYCAGITGMLYEGCALEEPPISGADKNSNKEDELRKKLLSAFINGRKRLHFANNKGKIDNSVFEQVATASVYSDRILGKNEVITMDNELEFSLSGNLGVSYTADFANRSRFVRLMYEEENANDRKFKNPDLHGWIFKNRSYVLSALYSLVKNWVDKGMPKGKVAFTSFPEWASICGGIMECAGYDSPCDNSDVVFNIGGDSESDNMKMLYEFIYEHKPEQLLTKKEIKDLLLEPEAEHIFSYINWQDRSDQINFGLIMEKFVNRVMSDIKLLSDNQKRSARRKYKFTKEIKENDITKIFGDEINQVNMSDYFKKDTKSGNVGNECKDKHQLSQINIKSNRERRGEIIPHITNITNNNKSDEDTIYSVMKDSKPMNIQDIVLLSKIEEEIVMKTIKKLRKKGDLFEVKPNIYQYIK